MTGPNIVDTGPLVAFLNRRDKYHDWTRVQWSKIKPPFLTAESVLSEACYLLRSFQGGSRAVMELLRRQVLRIPFRLEENEEEIAALLEKYATIPMSLADACLVRMAELHPDSTILTFDSDFTIYRKNKREVIPILSPLHSL